MQSGKILPSNQLKKTMDMFPIKNITLKSALGSNEQEPVIDEDMKTIQRLQGQIEFQNNKMKALRRTIDDGVNTIYLLIKVQPLLLRAM